MAKKDHTHLVFATLTVFCAKLLKEVIVAGDDVLWLATNQPREVCGSHGSIEATFKCECGHWHTIKIKDW